MSDKEKHLLFIAILSVIVLVNLILIYALFARFALGHKVDEINWLLGVFAAEILGCTVLAWRKIVNSEVAPFPTGTTPFTTNGEVSELSGRPIVIEKSALSEDINHADVLLKETGRKYLINARDKTITLEGRRDCAKRAIEIFARIRPDSPAYHSALYDMGIAYRVLDEFDKSINTYQKVRKLVRECGTKYTEDEKRCWESDIEMMIGTVYEEQGLLEQAETCYFNSWKLDPTNLVRMLNLHDIEVRLGKLEGARIWAEISSKHQNYSSVSHLIENKAEVTIP
jgi:tetratricopeptide (TPR) repeat protein